MERVERTLPREGLINAFDGGSGLYGVRGIMLEDDGVVSPLSLFLSSIMGYFYDVFFLPSSSRSNEAIPPVAISTATTTTNQPTNYKIQ